MNKETVNRLQNIAIVALSLSAILIVLRFPLISGGLTGRLQTLLTARPTDVGGQQSSDLTGLISAVHLSVAGEPEYGRFHQLYADVDGALFLELAPLFREALGSASPALPSTNLALQRALASPCLYLDLAAALPAELVAAWLGEALPQGCEGTLRAMALTGGEARCELYLLFEDGTVCCCGTALPADAVRQTALRHPPNGGRFAYETNYSTLSPYALLLSSQEALPSLNAALPSGYTVYNLLHALGYNTYTSYGYQESDGVEVIMDSPGTLRISPGGTVEFTESGEEERGGASLFMIRRDGEGGVTCVEAALAADALAQALSGGSGGSPMVLTRLTSTQDGYEAEFTYQPERLPVLFSNGAAALTVSIREDRIAAFVYRCRSYAQTEELTELLPPAMATAMAALRPGAALIPGYMDAGQSLLSPQWLAS